MLLRATLLAAAPPLLLAAADGPGGRTRYSLDAGWKFDPKAWAESQERHANDPPFNPNIAYKS